MVKNTPLYCTRYFWSYGATFRFCNSESPVGKRSTPSLSRCLPGKPFQNSPCFPLLSSRLLFLRCIPSRHLGSRFVLASIGKSVKTPGLHDDTYVWLDIFAINQNDTGSVISAMAELDDGRTLAWTVETDGARDTRCARQGARDPAHAFVSCARTRLDPRLRPSSSSSRTALRSATSRSTSGTSGTPTSSVTINVDYR